MNAVLDAQYFANGGRLFRLRFILDVMGTDSRLNDGDENSHDNDGTDNDGNDNDDDSDDDHIEEQALKRQPDSTFQIA